jgi:O-antigen ligase
LFLPIYPVRFVLTVIFVIFILLSGFRTALFAAVLYGLMASYFRRQYQHVLVMGFICISFAAILAIGNGRVFDLPLNVQRSLSFLPGNWAPKALGDAQGSTEWRVEMWRNVWPQVPRYLFKGKGYALDPQELYMAAQASVRGMSGSGEASAFAGDYHNGALSVLIPFGLYGAAAFLWLLLAGLRLLYRNYRYSDAELRPINTFLLAYYATQCVFFFLVFGALYHELFRFTGILGLSVALNGGDRGAANQLATTTS